MTRSRRAAGTPRRSLRRVQADITAVATVVLVVVLGVAGHVLVGLFARDLAHEVDERLLAVSGHVADFGPSDVPLPRIGDAGILAQVVDAEGAVVYSSRALDGEPALWAPHDGEGRLLTVGSGAVGPIRLVAVPFRDSWVVVAEPLRPVADAARSLEWAMLVGLVPLALVLAGLTWVAVGWSLRPVAAARAREERLVADVSHELRSPLAGLRALLETESYEPGDTALNRIEALGVLRRLDGVVDRLLALAGTGRTSDTGTARPVDLDEVVARLGRELGERSTVRVDLRGVGSGQAVGQEDQLVGVVENLLTNALRHARDVVEVHLDERGGLVELHVDDDGAGIAPEDRLRVFEPFTRLDAARSRAAGGAGLGLAIVHATVEAHGGTVAVGEAPLGGARLTVRLPASSPVHDDPPGATPSTRRRR